MKLEGVGALVAGGGSGLGRAAAEALAAAGGRVTILDRHLPTAGAAPGFEQADVRDVDQVQAAVQAAGRASPLRVLVNCAGIGSPRRILGEAEPHSLEEFQQTIDVNLVGTFNVLRLASAAIARAKPIEGERGVIINTASIAAFDGQVGQAAYAASKGGIVAMTLPIARELAGAQIRVATIAPGLFDTPLFKALPVTVRDELAASVPHPRRIGYPREFAALVRHIIENPMINGEVIRLDGAIRMA